MSNKKECCYCGKIKTIYVEDAKDPYILEIEPEEADLTEGDWCEQCWDQRVGDI